MRKSFLHLFAALTIGALALPSYASAADGRAVVAECAKKQGKKKQNKKSKGKKGPAATTKPKSVPFTL